MAKKVEQKVIVGVILLCVLILFVLFLSFNKNLSGKGTADGSKEGVISHFCAKTDANAEDCGDGNVLSGDGCSAICEVEDGWDCSTNNCFLTKTGFDEKMRQEMLAYELKVNPTATDRIGYISKVNKLVKSYLDH